MNGVKEILEAVKNGGMTVDEAERILRTRPYVDLGYARIDTHRRIRQGASEVVYSAGKTPEQTMGILDALI